MILELIGAELGMDRFRRRRLVRRLRQRRDHCKAHACARSPAEHDVRLEVHSLG